VTPAALSTAVQKARQAVGDAGERQSVLQTEHGKGFRFVVEVTDLSPPETAGAGAAGAAQFGCRRKIELFPRKLIHIWTAILDE
jgi:DNA-binding winged helix-turn-helix (wHTH) protein